MKVGIRREKISDKKKFETKIVCSLSDRCKIEKFSLTNFLFVKHFYS